MQEGKAPVLENTTKLEKFYQYLNYEISSSVLYVGIFLNVDILKYVLMIAAVIFTPYMLLVLYKEEKFGWITSFIVMVLLPILMLLIFAFQYNVLILLPFYFYCFLIRFEPKDWLREKRARNDLILQKIRKENEGAELEDWVVMK